MFSNICFSMQIIALIKIVGTANQLFRIYACTHVLTFIYSFCMNRMMQPGFCNAPKWVEFVEKMTPAQRLKLSDADVECMLDIQALRPRKTILSFMVKVFDAGSETFVIQDNQPGITVQGVDVEEIFGLKYKPDGLDAFSIIYEGGEDDMHDIPPHFLNKKSGNIKIDDLIEDAIKSQVADDDFLRRAVLVLLGTVLAPRSLMTIPPQYYSLVRYVKRLKDIDFNSFTRTYVMDNLKKLETGCEMKQWPKGNLLLVQVYISPHHVHCLKHSNNVCI